MKVTLKVCGREMTFSENELITILESHFSNKTVKTVETQSDGKHYIVDLKTINRSLFDTPRKDRNQEQVRNLILSAFNEADKNPDQYSQPFETIIPKKEYSRKRRKDELYVLAYKLGDHLANWVEQFLEFAQRISDGEKWESICNNPDISDCQRIIIWIDGEMHIIGSYYDNHSPQPAYIIRDFPRDSEDEKIEVYSSVPLVIKYL